METPIIYHNPRCSKSRATLALLESKGYQPQIIHYLDTPPDQQTLRQLSDMLSLSIRDMVRTGESAYQEANLASADDERLLNAIAEHPILLERPIVRVGSRAAIGRPPENVLQLLGNDAD